MKILSVITHSFKERHEAMPGAGALTRATAKGLKHRFSDTIYKNNCVTKMPDNGFKTRASNHVHDN